MCELLCTVKNEKKGSSCKTVRKTITIYSSTFIYLFIFCYVCETFCWLTSGECWIREGATYTTRIIFLDVKGKLLLLLLLLLLLFLPHGFAFATALWCGGIGREIEPSQLRISSYPSSWNKLLTSTFGYLSDFSLIPTLAKHGARTNDASLHFLWRFLIWLDAYELLAGMF